MVDMFPEVHVHVLLAAARHWTFNVDRVIAAVLDGALPPAVVAAGEATAAYGSTDARYDEFLARTGRVDKRATTGRHAATAAVLHIDDDEKEVGASVVIRVVVYLVHLHSLCIRIEC